MSRDDWPWQRTIGSAGSAIKTGWSHSWWRTGLLIRPGDLNCCTEPSAEWGDLPWLQGIPSIAVSVGPDILKINIHIVASLK